MKEILRLAPTMQSVALLGGTRKKKKGQMHNIVTGATKILVGVPLIKATSDVVESY